MTRKHNVLVFILMAWAATASAQKNQPAAADTSFENYDLLFSELDSFFDSLLKPRSYVLLNIGLSNGYFNSTAASGDQLKSERKLAYSPALSFIHKSGFGVSGSTTIISEDGKLNPYMGALSGSWDYVKSMKLVTGVSYSRFFTKDSLDFYTSPIENAVYAYFTYRDLWVRPTVAVNYGWGSRTETTERRERITLLRLRRWGYTTVNTTENVSDLTVTASLRKDFYWLDVMGANSFIKLSPQLAFVSGTQRFGFNQTSTTASGRPRINPGNLLFTTENVHLDDNMEFQPLSAAAVIRAEYSKGKFFIQPQIMFDYYIPATEKNFSSFFTLNAGVIF
jgi:hypothetical protein